VSDVERRRALLERAREIRGEQELARQHPAFLLDRVRMVDEKTGEEFRFHLLDPDSGWYWQRGTLDELVEHRKTIILKARQLGITWLCAAYQLWEALTKPGTRHMIYRQNEDEAIDVVQRIWLMFESLPEHLRFGVRVIVPRQTFQPSNRIVLEHPDGRISRIIGKVAKPARGSTAATVLFDEAAFIDDFRKVWSGTTSTVGSEAKMFIVSTANGVSDEQTGEGNYYHRLWSTAEDRGIHQVFLGWQMHPDRDQGWYDTSDETRSIDERERAQEYPSNPDEAFRLTTGTYYDADAIEEYAKGDPAAGGPHVARPVREIEFERKTATVARVVERRGALVRVYREPVEDHEYAIGADVATGRGKDFSAAYVIDLSNMEIAAEIRAKIDTDRYAFQLHYLGNRYNRAWISVDRTTGWGENVITALRDGREGRPPYPRLYRRVVDSRSDMPEHKPYGIQLNEQTRPLVVNQLGRALRDRSLPWVTSKLCSELKTFIEHTSGVTSPAAMTGSNDDCVMACAIALELYRQKGHWPDRKPRRESRRNYRTRAEQQAA
jgi:hypothetical protein